MRRLFLLFWSKLIGILHLFVHVPSITLLYKQTFDEDIFKQAFVYTTWILQKSVGF